MTLFDLNRKKAARLTLLSLVLMTVLAGFAFGVAHTNLVTLLESGQVEETTWMPEILAWTAIGLLDILIGITLYIYFKQADPVLSKVQAALRILYSVVLLAGVVQLLLGYLNQSSMSADQLLVYTGRFVALWSLGLIIFGLHLMVLGKIALWHQSVPVLISVLLLIAGFSYTFVHGLYWLAPSLDSLTGQIESILSIPMMVGELLFGLWLGIKGAKIDFLEPFSCE